MSVLIGCCNVGIYVNFDGYVVCFGVCYVDMFGCIGYYSVVVDYDIVSWLLLICVSVSVMLNYVCVIVNVGVFGVGCLMFSVNLCGVFVWIDGVGMLLLYVICDMFVFVCVGE